MTQYSFLDVKSCLPGRINSDNKTRGGKALIVAGSSGLEGAALLSAKAAARMGAGYVYIHTLSKKLLSIKNPDFLSLHKITEFPKYDFTAVALGPGFKSTEHLKKWIELLKKRKFKNVVLDAEALNFLSASKKSQKLPSSWILTPHEGELGKLLNTTSENIRRNRKISVTTAQKKFGCIILLKGYQTLVATSDKVVLIPTGNPALAKAGTGDVLTGIICGLLSQNVPAFKAACTAAYIHGLIADEWINTGHDILSLMATDLIEMIPQTLTRFRT